jgi:hypothetical protein
MLLFTNVKLKQIVTLIVNCLKTAKRVSRFHCGGKDRQVAGLAIPSRCPACEWSPDLASNCSARNLQGTQSGTAEAITANETEPYACNAL